MGWNVLVYLAAVSGEEGEAGVEEYVQVIVIRRARLPTGRNRHGGICSYPAREDTGPPGGIQFVCFDDACMYQPAPGGKIGVFARATKVRCAPHPSPHTAPDPSPQRDQPRYPRRAGSTATRSRFALSQETSVSQRGGSPRRRRIHCCPLVCPSTR